MNNVHFSSKSNEWGTDPALFEVINREFGFTLDAAASEENAKCDRFYGVAQDGLSQCWDGVVFCNPPYGSVIGKWVEKGLEESRRGAVVVMLIPARTCTGWWHDFVMRAAEVRLFRGRLRFAFDGTLAPVNAPFPSCLVVFRPGDHRPVFTSVDRIVTATRRPDHSSRRGQKTEDSV